jgi:hypothetical protein
MRYTPPKYIISETSGLISVKYGENIKPTAQATIFQKSWQPRIELNRDLRIFTKAGKMQENVFRIDKELLGTTKSGNEIVKQTILREGTLPTTKFTSISEVKAGTIVKRPLVLDLTQPSKIPVKILENYRETQVLSGRTFTGEWKKTDLVFKGFKKNLYFSKDETILIKYTGKAGQMKGFRLLQEPKPYVETTPTKIKTFEDLSQKELIVKFKDIAKMYERNTLRIKDSSLKYTFKNDGNLKIKELKIASQNTGVKTKLINKLQKLYPEKVITAVSTDSNSGYYKRTGWKSTNITVDKKLGKLITWTKEPTSFESTSTTPTSTTTDFGFFRKTTIKTPKPDFTQQQMKEISATVKDIYGVKSQTSYEKLKLSVSKYLPKFDQPAVNYQSPQQIEALKYQTVNEFKKNSLIIYYQKSNKFIKSLF